MAKSKKINPPPEITAAMRAQIEELIRTGRMPSLDQVVAAIEETREKYRPLIIAARKGPKLPEESA